MAPIDALLERNKHFAADRSVFSRAPAYPRSRACVVTCVDARTDPALFLQTGVGDLFVIRNAGGRVTQTVIDDIAYLSYLGESFRPGEELFEVAIVHHTQCGTASLADPDFRRRYADRVGGDDAELAGQAVADPAQTVRRDVDKLRSASVVSRKITVSGHVYDVETGLVETVIAATEMP